MATIQEINSTIISGVFTNEQLNSIAMALKFARGQLTQKNKHRMVKGTRVKFVSSKSGQTVQGVVTDIKRKFIYVLAGNTNWRVPGNMLELV